MPSVDEKGTTAMTELRAAWRRHVRHVNAAEKSREEVHQAIAQALQDGFRPRDVIDATGLSAESVRRIAREQGLPPLQKQAGVPVRRAERGGR